MFYRYGMHKTKIDKIRDAILEGKKKEDICQKFKISYGQWGFVNDVIVKGSKKHSKGELKSFSEIDQLPHR